MKQPESGTAPATFFVSPLGDDEWSGTLVDPADDRRDGPFRSIDRARDAARKLAVSGKEHSQAIVVTVRGGMYMLGQSFLLDQRDSGTIDAPVVYQAAAGEQVILAGGIRLSCGDFLPVTDRQTIVRLDAAARGHVMQADLRTIGVGDLGDFPVKCQGMPEVPELFFNGTRQTLARWPNDGWTTIARIVSPGSWLAPPDCPTTGEGGIFEYDDDRPSRWRVDAGVWLHGYWCFDWHDELIQVKDINRDTKQIALAAPALYGVKPRNPSPRRWRAINLLEELDCPGEYYIDRRTGMLYFWPPAPLEGASIVLSTLRAPVVSIRDAEHLTVRGFTFEASLAGGISVTGGRDVHIETCVVRNTRGPGIAISGGTNHRVDGCTIHHTGSGGIHLAGGDRRNLTPAGHVAVNNHIHHFSQHRMTGGYAIWLLGVGNRAAHNLIHHAPHQAINIGGNDHVLEYNIIHHVCMETDDCGACYKGRNPSCRGNVIRYNYWHDIGSPRGHGNGAIYFDDGDGGDIVFGNVFHRCCEPGKAKWGAIYSHGGHGLLAENNIFIDCKRALGSGPWSDERWVRCLAGTDGHDWPNRLLHEVDITRPPYTTRYPELIGFMEWKPGTPRTSRATRNVIVNCGDVCSGNWEVDADENWITSSDPGFVNAEQHNFGLRSDSAVYRKLPGFQPIPFDAIGLIGRGALGREPTSTSALQQ